MRADDLINVMESFLDIKEIPPGSNLTPIGVEYGWNGVAWCAETVSVACRRLGFPLHEAAVIRIERHGRDGDWGMGWTRIPIRGSAVCFDWNGHGNPSDMHVGIVTEILNNGRFRTIEGNYQDRCARVLRDMTFVRGFATFPFDNAPSVVVPPPNPTPADTVHHLMMEGKPVARVDVKVSLDSDGNGYQPTDIPEDKVLAITSHAPLYPPRDKKYGKMAKAGHHMEDGKLVVFVESGEPKQTALIWVTVAD